MARPATAAAAVQPAAVAVVPPKLADPNASRPTIMAPARPRTAAGDPDHGGLHRRQPHQPAIRGAPRPQERLLTAPPGGSGGGDGRGEQDRQDRAGQAEEQEQHLGVRGVLACRAERRAEVVADEGTAGGTRLQVVRGGRDGRVGGSGVGGQPVRARDVELGRDQVGPRLGERVEDLVPGRLRQQEHVVGRRGRLRAGGRADLLEERVGLRQVDDAVDAYARRAEPGTADAHRVARQGVQVGRGLLGDQRAGRGAREEAQLSGERTRVGVRDAQDDARTGGLRGGAGAGEAGGTAEAHRERRAHSRCGPHGGEDGVRIGAGGLLHLPVHGDLGGGPPGHGRLGGGEEGAEGAEERHGDGDAGRDHGQA